MKKLDPNQSYMMPAHFGPRYSGAKSSGWYHDVTSMSVSYITDSNALRRYLPDCFEVPERPVITVSYACNKNIDWLAGHGYNLIGVHASVIHRGTKDQLTGSYTLVMWENLTDPILTGREMQGISKVYADIPEHRTDDGGWTVDASHFGHNILDLSLSDMVEVPLSAVVASQQANKANDNPMGYRYTPAISGFGVGEGQATLFPSEHRFTQVMQGRGEVNWQQLTWEQNPTQYHIANALAGLPILEYLPAVITKGSTNLYVLDRLPRALN